MKWIGIGLAAAAALVLLLVLAVPRAGASGKEPGVGDMAPDFELPGSDGKVHRLADYRGKQAVVVAWFPKAFTGG